MTATQNLIETFEAAAAAYYQAASQFGPEAAAMDAAEAAILNAEGPEADAYIANFYSRIEEIRSANV